jgi:signal transduction histidine kinase
MRGAATARGPWVRRVSILAALALGTAVEWHAAVVGAPVVTFILPDAIGGLMFIGTGAVAWRRRPENFTGPVLVASGAMWFVGSSEGSPIGAVASLSYSFGGYYDPALAFLALAFPFGRLQRTAERVVVGGMLGVMGIRSLARLLLNEPSVYFDCPCPPNPFRLALNEPLYLGVERFGTAAIAALAMAALVLLVGRLFSGTRAARRVSTPVVLAGAAAMLIAMYHHAGRASLFAFGNDLLPQSEALHDLVIWTLFFGRALVPLGFLLGVLQLRTARRVVADLVLDLSDPAPHERLRSALIHALGDPSLEVVYWSPELGTYADQAGGPAALPAEDDPKRAVTVIERRGDPLAALIHDPALLEEQGLLESVGAAFRLAVENDRLRARVEEQLKEVRASRARIVAAGDEERRRVERNLHDGAQQRLLTLSLALRMARAQAASSSDQALGQTLAEADEELKRALAEIRELARGIHPVVLSRAGLSAALRSLAERSSVPVEILEAPSERFAPTVEAGVYFVVSESLANVTKHADATRATVSVMRSNDTIRVEIADDGVGGADLSAGSGLLSLRDRVAALGGSFRVKSPTGSGTTVVAEIPLQDEAP